MLPRTPVFLPKLKYAFLLSLAFVMITSCGNDDDMDGQDALSITSMEFELEFELTD